MGHLWLGELLAEVRGVLLATKAWLLLLLLIAPPTGWTHCWHATARHEVAPKVVPLSTRPWGPGLVSGDLLLGRSSGRLWLLLRLLLRLLLLLMLL